MAASLLEDLRRRHEDLRIERSSWESNWRQITEQLIPYRVVWDQHERNRGDRKESKIINTTPVRALNVLSSGMMAGVTSPARVWFALTIDDKDLADFLPVRQYLDDARKRLLEEFAVSGWYTELANATYPDLGSIGQSLLLSDETAAGRMLFRARPIGEYYLDIDSEDVVDTCFREKPMTVRQIVQKFGLKSCSTRVRDQWDRSEYNQVHQVVHAVVRNEEYDYAARGMGYRGKPWLSCWWEDVSDDMDGFLGRQGYHEFPVLAPRWSHRPGDAYGRGPGWEVRGECRALQHMEKQKMRLIDKVVDPPMKVSKAIKRASLLPGDATILPNDNSTYEPAVNIDPRAYAFANDCIAKHEERIEAAMHVGLWQAFINDDRAQPRTAEEVKAANLEKMLMLGPVLENLNNDLLEPAVSRAYAIMERNGRLPRPPEELQGREIKVEFISIMHQMQQATGLGGIRTLVQNVAALSELDRQVVDKIDTDVLVDEVAQISGIRPDAVRSAEQAGKIREARAKAEQAEQQGAALLAATQGARNLSGIDPQQISQVSQALVPAAAVQGGVPPGRTRAA